MILWQGQVFSMVFCQGNWQGHLPSFGKGIFLMRHCEVKWVPWLISGNQMSTNLKMFAVINKTRKIETWDGTFHHLLVGASGLSQDQATSWSSSVDASVTENRGYHKLQFQRGTWWSSMAGCGVPHFQTNPGCLFHPVCMPRFDIHSFSCFPKNSFPLTTLGLCNVSRQISIFWYMISRPYIASSKGFIFEPRCLPQVLGWTGVTSFGKHHFKGTEQFQPCSVVWHIFTACIDES